MSSDNFTPNTSFEGYVYAKLESMNERLNALPCDETFKRLNKAENDISNIQGKATILGSLAGFITFLIGKLISGK